MHRRTFLAGSAALAAAPALARGQDVLAVDQFPISAPRYRKGVKLSMLTAAETPEAKFKLARDAGFAGVDVDGDARDVPALLAARDATGLPVHGVVYGRSWKTKFSDPDPAGRAEALDGLKSALRDCKELGGTSVLVVPAVVDAKTLYGDAYERALAGIAGAVPVAEETGVDILFENVWNNFLLSPLEMANFIDAFESDSVGAYFDVGNVVRYGWPTHWIAALGKRIRKLDVKEYSRELQREEGLWKGFGVNIGDGGVDWPGVRAALEAIDFRGWATAEVPGGDLDRLTDVAERMDEALGLG